MLNMYKQLLKRIGVNMKIDKCNTCSEYDHKNDCMRNKLRCIFKREDLQLDQARKAFEYNRAISGDNSDTELIHEHGKQVFGSGWKNELS